MRIAGAFRPAGALFTDILMITLLAGPFAYLASVDDGPSTLIWVCGVVGYSLLAFSGAVPSLGRWTLGLRRYNYDEITQYPGRGVLYVYENLSSKAYTHRTLISLVLLLALAGFDMLIIRVFPGGPD